MPEKTRKPEFKLKYVRQVSEEPDCPNMKMDILSPFESFWLAMCISAALSVIAALHIFLLGEASDAYYFLKAGGIALLVGFIGYNLCNEYYLLDFSKKVLFFHSEKFGMVSETVAAQPFEMGAITVDASPPGPHNADWLYRIILVLKNNDVIPLSDYNTRKNDLDKINKKAQSVAKNFAIPFYPSPGNIFTKPVIDQNGDLKIEFVKVKYWASGNSTSRLFAFFILFIFGSIIFFGTVNLNHLFSW